MPLKLLAETSYWSATAGASNVTNMTNIVVIDSEPTVRSVIAAILESAGYSVRATGEFTTALEMLYVSRPDLVLTNVFLRGIAGHDAMRRLKREFPGLPVLMVSGLPDDEAIAEWNGEVGFDVFPKPFTRDELVEKIRQVLPSAAASP